MQQFRPQLAATINKANEHLVHTLNYPLLLSPKYDGYRGLIMRGPVLNSRKLLRFPNKYAQRIFEISRLAYCEGEMIAGDPLAENCRNRTSSAVMDRDNVDEELKLYVFDHFQYPNEPYLKRLARLKDQVEGLKHVVVVPQTMVSNPDKAFKYEAQHAGAGYEGIMLRHPNAPYKHGRSTLKEQYLIKWKRFVDSEAEILEVFEQEKNANELTKDELGYAKRSSAKDGKVKVGRLGGFRVRDIHTKVEFYIGTWKGMTLEGRKELWKIRDKLPGKFINYRSQAVGVKTAPLFGVITGFRDPIDILTE